MRISGIAEDKASMAPTSTAALRIKEEVYWIQKEHWRVGQYVRERTTKTQDCIDAIA
ncbi:hypothetical protein [Pyrococcus kukulkanii]|uniref:Transposase n=1 Tax=Pyrococcus kukulkanii TaxID=1609559 RepID=A0ABV4T5J2_9EURY|nr:hypothetical protein [Pyrococcus kukulkanii]